MPRENSSAAINPPSTPAAGTAVHRGGDARAGRRGQLETLRQQRLFARQQEADDPADLARRFLASANQFLDRLAGRIRAGDRHRHQPEPGIDQRAQLPELRGEMVGRAGGRLEGFDLLRQLRDRLFVTCEPGAVADQHEAAHGGLGARHQRERVLEAVAHLPGVDDPLLRLQVRLLALLIEAGGDDQRQDRDADDDRPFQP